MKYEWKNLDKPLNCFTVRNAMMVNLDNGKIVSNYAANTKIAVAQKCVTPNGTYYRTNEAVLHNLNYAFKASAFGLPSEKAPLAHTDKTTKVLEHRSKTASTKSASRTPKPAKKQKSSRKAAKSKNGGTKRLGGVLRKIFRIKK